MPLDDPKKDPKLADKNEPAEGAKPANKKGLPPLVMYIGISVVMIVIGYFGATKFMGSAQEIGSDAIGTEEHVKSDKSVESDHASLETEMINIDDIIVNPSGTGGTRFLSASIGFEVTGKETPALFEKKMPMIRDALIAILGSKTIDQLSDAKEKEITRYQIKKRIEQLLKTDDLAAVYFTDFVLQ